MSIVSVLILIVVAISIVWAFKTGYIKALSEDGIMQILWTLSKTDYYSEIFVSTPIGYGVGRLYSDPFNVLASSSKAEDVEAVNHYRNQGLNTAEAIEAVLRERAATH